MNKVLQSCLIALAATALFSACQKDKEHLVDLTAVIVDQPVSNAKVYIDGNYGCWQQGDAVKIKSGSNGTDSYSLTVAGSGEVATKATINNVKEGTPYTAGYPGGNVTAIDNGTLNIEVPSSQSYVEAAIYNGAATNKQRIVCPMAAYSSDGSTLKFYNVAAMLAVTVTNSESSALTLYAVEVESDKSPLSGTATVTVNADTAYISSKASTSNNVTLTFDTPVTLAASKSKKVYIPVLPIGSGEGEKSTLTVHVKATKSDGTKKYTFHDVSRSAISIAQNQIGNVPITLNTSNPETEVNDYFWGQGTEACPYLITDSTDLSHFSSQTSGCFRQTKDIDYGGSYSHPDATFTGHYDGGGHIIRFKLSNTGLFKTLGNGAEIKNLTLKGDPVTTSAAKWGAFCCEISNSAKVTLKNCTNKISCTSTGSNGGLGGLIGYASNSSLELTLENCSNKANNISGKSNVGGVLGYASVKIIKMTGCSNEGAVTCVYGMTACVGGLVALAGLQSGNSENKIDLDRCVNSGAVTMDVANASMGACGGIIGCLNEKNSNIVTITNCANKANVSAGNINYMGGIVGKLQAPTDDTCRCNIFNSYSTGNLSSSGTVSSTNGGGMGGIMAIYYKNTPLYKIKINNCYFSGSLSAKTSKTNYSGIVSRKDDNITCTNCYSTYTEKGGSANGLTLTATSIPTSETLNSNRGSHTEWSSWKVGATPPVFSWEQ